MNEMEGAEYRRCVGRGENLSGENERGSKY